MATILIVSRTQMKNGVCVGGINEDNYEFIRIHDNNGANLPTDAPYRIGDRWNMDVETAWNRRQPPHTEDKQITMLTFPRRIENIRIQGVRDYVRKNAASLRIAQGSIANAFLGMLHLDGTKAYINHQRVPPYSTEFWIAGQNLEHLEQYNKHYYFYDNVRIPFVGFQEPVETIPAGTIIRLSLANWWDNGCGEERCYLQLSGWYL